MGLERWRRESREVGEWREKEVVVETDWSAKFSILIKIAGGGREREREKENERRDV